MKVSVIIPTYNEEKVIVKCLVSLSKQDYKDVEIVVVDDGSRDDTRLKVQKVKDKLSLNNLKLVSQKHKGTGSARNVGAKKSSGDILVFLDADMTFNYNFISNLLKPIIKGEAKGTFSKEEYVSNWQNIWARSWNINEGWMQRKRHPKSYPDKQKVFRAIVREEFVKAGGFDASKGYVDDWTLSDRLGYLAVVAPGAVFYHRNPDSLKEVFIQAKWVSKRNYKFGIIGVLFALLRSSLPFSLIIAVYKTIKSRHLPFILFKTIYDFGVFIGIIEYHVFHKSSR
jgi:glycosyltransferase involved in cell wall biosynthesis